MEAIEKARKNIEDGFKLIGDMDKVFERWAPIQDYPNYKVSTLGRVQNIITGKFLKPQQNRGGYNYFCIINESGKKHRDIHRLLSLAFIPNINNKKCVDHIDGDKTNNNITNLRWATHTENNRNSMKRSHNKSGIKGVSWNKQCKKWEACIRINNKTNHLGMYANIEDANKAYENKAKEVFGDFYKANNM
jgi:hypothetical protein